MQILAAGTYLGRFKLLHLLGRGGMGEVWKAHDPRLGREVAIKVLPPDLAKDPDLRTRFERESKILAALNHPCIAQIFEADEETPLGIGTSGSPEPVSFLVMEFIEGKSLSEILLTRKPSVLMCVRLGRQIARALAAAHKAGIIHRDLKPANIMVTPKNQVKVLDFGLARPLTNNPTIPAFPEVTIPGMVMGTAAYLSPEQVKGNPADAHTDIWALGCVLYQMFSGKRPFDSNSVPEILAGILRDEPRSLSDINPNLPPDLIDLIEKCLAKAPDQRPAAAGEIANTLKEIAEQLGNPYYGTTRDKVQESPPGTPNSVSIDAINRFLREINQLYPQLRKNKTGATFAEINHEGAKIGILVAAKPNDHYDVVGFISPLFAVPSGNLQAFFRRLLVVSNGHTDVAQFSIDTESNVVNLICIRQCSTLSQRQFRYTLDTMRNVILNIANPLKAQFGIS